MESGDEQTSLWEQSNLLDLVGASACPAQASQPSATTPAQAPPGGAGVAAETRAQAGLQPEATAEMARATAADPGVATAAAHAHTAAEQQRAPSPEDGLAVQRSGSGDSPRNGESTETPSAAQQPGTGSARSPVLPPLPHLSDIPALPACPERLLILDTETTALSPQQGQCIEVGAVLFDVASRSVLMQVSFLLPCALNPAQAINGIPAAVSRLNQPWRSGLSCFEAMVADTDVLLAHNAAFDRQWFGSGELPALNKPWICSMEDIHWPAERQLRATPSVRDLALAYGVPVWAAHRALTDCIYLVQVFQRCEDLETLLRLAREPRRLVRARLSYDERQLAKDAGFRWNDPVPKAWSRRLSAREIAALPFAVDPVETEPPGRQRGETATPLWCRSA